MSQEMRHHVRDLVERIDLHEAVRRRAVQDTITEILAHTHTDRAAILEAALPQPGDYPGGPVDWATGDPLDPPAPREETEQDLRAAVLACRQKAALLERRWIDG